MEDGGLRRVLERIRATSGSDKEKGARFERLMLDFFKSDARYKDHFRNVWLWDEHPDRRHRDLGVDLVAEGRDGTRTAIQCKFYQQSSTIAKRNIDSFLGALGKREFKDGIVVSTTDRWSDNAQEALSRRSKTCVRIGPADLAASDIDWWETYKRGKASRRPKKRLRPHQRKALEDVLRGFKGADRGRLIMPCGTGKTLTALRIVERAAGPGGSALVLTPSLSLVSQLHREFLQNAKGKTDALIVCSDKKAGQDDDISQADLPLPPTTDAAALARELRALSRNEDGLTVVFSTYHSIDVVARAQRKSAHGAVRRRRLRRGPPDHGDRGRKGKEQERILLDENPRQESRQGQKTPVHDRDPAHLRGGREAQGANTQL